MHAKCVPKLIKFYHSKNIYIFPWVELKSSSSLKIINFFHGLIWRQQLIQVASDTNWCVDGAINGIRAVFVTMRQSQLRGAKSSQMRGRNWVKVIGFLWFVLLGVVIYCCDCFCLDYVQRFLLLSRYVNCFVDFSYCLNL